MTSLQNKVVLITGSSIGIGRETAYKLAKEKCRLIITFFKDKKEGEITAKKCLELGSPEVLLLQLNVMDDKSIKNAVEKVISKFKYINILINNAGVVVWKYLKDQTFQDIENQIRTNLEGLIKITKEFLPIINEMIINISSEAGLHGYDELTTYCASKFGVIGFTQSLAKELKIKVYAICPGAYATRMNNFQGMPVEQAAQRILDVAKGKCNLKSGDYIKI